MTRFRPGDAVVAFPDIKLGCHAQFRVLAEDGAVAAKPAHLSFDEADALPFGFGLPPLLPHVTSPIGSTPIASNTLSITWMMSFTNPPTDPSTS